MSEQITTIEQINEYNQALDEKRKRGRPRGSSNLHSKHPSGIGIRLKAAGVDWVASLGAAIQKNDKVLLSLWLRLLPYLIVTGGTATRVKRGKGRVTKAAMQALDELEGRE